MDVVTDLEKTPWPWKDNSVDAVYASHTLEHLADPLAAMLEIHRILKPGGTVRIFVPHASGVMACSIFHKHPFAMQWFQDLSECPHLQNGMGLMFPNSKFRLGVGYHRHKMPWHIRLWERYWNKTFLRQRRWETLGIIHPAEIEWTATKT
ncbi:MAG: class I SAM-dependent methyltransferase [Kiritimatiellaeota bacterium]|nr:class I SAM-dependent methyltransferase [Kiritimatiellota bacterium]